MCAVPSLTASPDGTYNEHLDTTKIIQIEIWPIHTVNSVLEMVEAKHVSGKNICCVKMLEKHVKTRKKIFVHCPFL